MTSLSNTLVFDIETAPNSLVEDHSPEFTVPSNYKDPEKIARCIEGKQKEFFDKAALDLDYARITAIGAAMGNGEVQAVLVGADQTEKDALKWFWSQVAQAKTVCGYNITGFDLPIIQRRSFVLSVTPTRRLFDLKPWDAFTLDLMRSFYHNGYGPGVKYRGLKAVCAMFGIENPLPELDGSQAAGMDSETLRVYVINDVRMTRELARRMQGHYW
jgi:predicted PolB exonuclease-like 3'-5' exonuclease